MESIAEVKYNNIPEPIWERNDNSYVAARLTGKSHLGTGDGHRSKGGLLIGTFVLDNENEKETFIPARVQAEKKKRVRVGHKKFRSRSMNRKNRNRKAGKKAKVLA